MCLGVSEDGVLIARDKKLLEQRGLDVTTGTKDWFLFHRSPDGEIVGLGIKGFWVVDHFLRRRVMTAIHGRLNSYYKGAGINMEYATIEGWIPPNHRRSEIEDFLFATRSSDFGKMEFEDGVLTLPAYDELVGQKSLL